MTMKVNVGISELASDLSGYMTTISGDRSGAQYGADLLESQEYSEFIRKCLQDKNSIINQENDADVEGCFNVLCALVSRVTSSNARRQLVKDFIADLVDDTEDKALMRLKVLTNLYNFLEEPHERLEVLLAALRYASATQNLKLLNSYLPKIYESIESWNVSNEEKRELYHTVFQVLNEADEKSALSQEYLRKYLLTFQDASDEDLAAAKENVAHGAVAFIRQPIEVFAHHDSVLELPVVRQLRDDPEYAKLFRLLQIFSIERLPNYMEFYSKNKSVIKQYGLDHEANVKHMRLLSLCSLAADHTEIPYTEVAETLQVDLEEVENWVVEAITSDLMEAKMDQLRQVVSVKWFAWREFGDKEWRHLASKLKTWTANVRGLLQKIEESRSKRP